jgi:enamine deaminase RidA (YjgF/YER057c/UK114 family)
VVNYQDPPAQVVVDGGRGAAIEAELGLENVTRVLKVTGFVASADGFVEQPEVVNPASELLVEVLGSPGRHARSAIGVAWLPGNAPVEVEAIVSGAPKETARGM